MAKSTGIEEEPRPKPRSPITATTGRGNAYPSPVRRQVRSIALVLPLRTTDAKRLGSRSEKSRPAELSVRAERSVFGGRQGERSILAER
jgi:hypothetical protein